MSYILIWDTGDSVFASKTEALKYASYLKKKGHRLDRLQVYRYAGKSYKTMPKIIKSWYRKRKR